MRFYLAGQFTRHDIYTGSLQILPLTFHPPTVSSLFPPSSPSPFFLSLFLFLPFQLGASRDTSLLPFLLFANRVLLPPSLLFFFFIPLSPTCSTGRMHRERRAFAALERAQIRVRRNTNCSDRRSHIFSTAPEACRGRRSTRNEIETRGPLGRRARDRKGDQRWWWRWRGKREKKKRETFCFDRLMTNA